MGIKDIPLSTTPASAQAIPVPPSLESIIQTAKGQISNDPQSGSILKLLSENGFKEKIQEGYKNGRTYTILHAAPSPDFTLIENWTETTKDENGNSVSNPRKTYQFFKIVIDTPPVQETSQPATPLEEVAPEPAPTELVLPPKEPEPVETHEAIAEIPTIIPTEQPMIDRAFEVAQKIKRGGAGMTPEDWQYRNENWPAIEKHLMPAQATSAPVQAPIAPEPKPATVTEKEVVVTPSSESVPPASAPVQQHYDSKAWLMQKLGSPKAVTPVQATTSASAQASSSYDMLKARFAKTTAATPVQENASTTTQENSDQRRNTFIQSIFANAPQEWELAKTIPARAFIYPTEYAWGSDEQGNQISRTLEDFPSNAKKLREKIAQPLEDLATQGVNIETISLDQAIIDLFDKGIL
ncbi:MAG: hypothetical protein WCG20_02220 [bacterium]